MKLHGTQAPSKWVTRWAHLIQPQAQVLDLACGYGRHTRFLAGLGHRLVAVDKDPEALASLQGVAQLLQADIENQPWPLSHRLFDAIVVTHYLWRPLMPRIMDCLAPEGVLIYETFAQGNETVGKPSRPDFLLQSGELLKVCQGLRIVAYQDGFLSEPDHFVQRIVAVKETAQTPAAKHYAIQA
jgi:SAM-dependent methyltransferase